MLSYIVVVAILVPLFLILSALRVTREYERGVVFLLGRFWRVKGPGLILSSTCRSRT
jgi:regulator of protease activity HflC (stomatin/prohibitin superfamily)